MVLLNVIQILLGGGGLIEVDKNRSGSNNNRLVDLRDLSAYSKPRPALTCSVKSKKQ